jgi:hypothetical protein
VADVLQITTIYDLILNIKTFVVLLVPLLTNILLFNDVLLSAPMSTTLMSLRVVIVIVDLM